MHPPIHPVLAALPFSGVMLRSIANGKSFGRDNPIDVFKWTRAFQDAKRDVNLSAIFHFENVVCNGIKDTVTLGAFGVHALTHPLHRAHKMNLWIKGTAMH